jgi:hypothetical protein
VPYIVTTTRPVARPDAAIFRHQRAVATLGEAREAAMGEVEAVAFATAGFDHLHTVASELPEAGGTIGPLPDGTVIEVERMSVERLCNMIPPEVLSTNALAWSRSSDLIIDAFNAQQEA